jgi:hypothetical protein
MVEWLNKDQKEQEAVMAYFKVVQQHLQGLTEEDHTKLQSG